VENAAHMGEMRNAHKILVEIPECKRAPGISTRNIEDNIKMYFDKQGVTIWNTFIWLRIGTSGGVL
jgi:hypothetical protein